MQNDVVIPIPMSENNGCFLPANAEDVSTAGPDGLRAFDPWTHANLAVMADKSQPETGPYGEPSQAKAATIVAEWGGMPNPVRDYQDQSHTVLQLRRPVRNNQGPAGQFNGPQQTAFQAQYVAPENDYWSVITGG